MIYNQGQSDNQFIDDEHIREQDFPALVKKAQTILAAHARMPVGPAVETGLDPVVDPVGMIAPQPPGMMLGAAQPAAGVVDATASQHREVFQGFLHDQIVRNAWLGSSVSITPANRLDAADGVDSILTVQPVHPGETPEFIGLQIFFRGPKIEETFTGIREKILSDTLTPITTLRLNGQHIRVPQVAIGAGNAHRQEALDMWAKGNDSQFRSHAMAFLLVSEIRLQLEVFKNFALQSRVEDTAERYGRSLELMNTVAAAMFPPSQTDASVRYVQEDDVWWRIVVQLVRTFECESEDLARFFRSV